MRMAVAEEVAVPGLEEHMGGRIRARRELMGLSAEALAKRSGVPLMRLQAYEAGSRQVIVDDLFRLCRTLEASPATFLRGIPDPRDGAGGDEAEERRRAPQDL